MGCSLWGASHVFCRNYCKSFRWLNPLFVSLQARVIVLFWIICFSYCFFLPPLKPSLTHFLINVQLYIAAHYFLSKFWGEFAKLRKATTSFVCPSVLPSFCPHGTIRLPLDGFSWNLTLEYFSKYFEKIQVSLKSDKNNRCFTWKPLYVFENASLSSF